MHIWKWYLRKGDEQQTLLLPKGARILTIQLQNEQLSLWALCEQGANLESRDFIAYSTGNFIPNDPGEYIGTVQLTNVLVKHFFEVTHRDLEVQTDCKGAYALPSLTYTYPNAVYAE